MSNGRDDVVSSAPKSRYKRTAGRRSRRRRGRAAL